LFNCIHFFLFILSVDSRDYLVSGGRDAIHIRRGERDLCSVSLAYMVNEIPIIPIVSDEVRDYVVCCGAVCYT